VSYKRKHTPIDLLGYLVVVGNKVSLDGVLDKETDGTIRSKEGEPIL